MFRALLLADTEAEGESGGQRGRRRPIDYGRLYPLGEVPDYEPAPETSVLRLATSRGIEPAELLLDLLAENDGRNFLYTPFSNYADGNLDACGEMLAHPLTVLGLGDGGAHVGLISDASFPTYALSHWARDRAHGRLPLGQVVEQLTSVTAGAVGLPDRGVLAPGLRADLNVIDFDHLACAAPVMAYDLPAGGKRLLQGSHGYCATLVAGTVTYRDGEPTGALPGRLVRGGRATTAQREEPT
jgi:N-acyl-D-aspartate/D-glutamate deacylase